MNRKFLTLLIFLLPFFIFAGCSKRIYRVAYPTLNDGRYDSEFPYKSSSAELQKVTETVRKLSSIAYYKSYVFTEGNPAVLSDIRDQTLRAKAVSEIIFNNSVIGTATVLFYENRKIVVMTCAHVVDFPDTIITYFKTESGISQIIQSVSFKQRQDNFIADLPERGQLEILAMDQSLDIALLGRQFEQGAPAHIPVFHYPLGKATDLEWGSFVYMVGYPKGYQMITKGIVSQPNRDRNKSFIVDALFNKGFSGGIVLAIRDGVPNFEMVGMASSVSADFDYYLTTPSNLNHSSYDPRIPYKDDVHIKFEKSINYGITFVIATEAIQDFIGKHVDDFLARGYDLRDLLK